MRAPILSVVNCDMPTTCILRAGTHLLSSFLILSLTLTLSLTHLVPTHSRKRIKTTVKKPESFKTISNINPAKKPASNKEEPQSDLESRAGNPTRRNGSAEID